VSTLAYNLDFALPASLTSTTLYDGAAEKHVRSELVDHETVPHRLGPNVIEGVSSPGLKFIPKSVSVVNVAVAVFDGLNSVRTGASKVSVFSIFVTVPTMLPTTTDSCLSFPAPLTDP
jgi:hypothetical protein